MGHFTQSSTTLTPLLLPPRFCRAAWLLMSFGVRNQTQTFWVEISVQSPASCMTLIITCCLWIQFSCSGGKYYQFQGYTLRLRKKNQRSTWSKIGSKLCLFFPKNVNWQNWKLDWAPLGSSPVFFNHKCCKQKEKWFFDQVPAMQQMASLPPLFY